MDLELDLKCTMCGYQCSIEIDHDIPIRCQVCNGFVVIEDYTVFE